MELSKEIVQEYVKQLNQGTGGCDYKKGLEDMGRLNLKSITKNEIEKVIQPFLYEWGWMQRVLERIEYLSWREDLATQTHCIHDKLEGFKTKDLGAVELAEHESDIKSCYESLKAAVGPVAAAKALHFVCPNFFPPWDRKIAKAARRERNRDIWRMERVEEYSAEDYYVFMRQMQGFIQKRDIISKLANKYGKSKVKIADECLWMATQRPLCLFF
jgi:hypothetical protein